ncbi:MAG: SIR2 family protein [Firmicutes bacterium]|nr:SIR2 family protein [Bacillota bacterium]
MIDCTNIKIPLPYWMDFSDLYKKADAICHAYNSRNLVFFLGSGVSKAFNPMMPNWSELLNNLLSEIRTGSPQQRDEILKLINSQRYLLAAEAIKQYAISDTDNKDLAIDQLVAKILQQRMNRSDHNPILHLAILDFSVPIFTTNYDNIIETLIADYKVDSYNRTAITYEDEQDAANFLSPSKKYKNYVFKLHGSVDKAHRLILDEKDYSDFYFNARWPISLKLLRHTLATKMVVFIGFSLSDPEIMLILREAMRHSASYQHIALLHKPEVSPIEIDVIRSNYRVDPILYEEHSHLPLFVMEMRNFYHRENISLQIKAEKIKLLQAFQEIKKEEKLQPDCSVILFGSYAKYGPLSQPQADIDVLFLTDCFVSKSRVQSEAANRTLQRKIDATVMQRSEFEKLLRYGDPFASSVLVTGCPLEDIDGSYGTLSRGFIGNYDYNLVLQNAMNRYRIRWIRLCIYRDAELQDYLQACHQWSMSLMQLFLIKNNYPLDSLLSMSLLGNARFTIREFAVRFGGDFEEEFFVSLMHSAKGISLNKDTSRPSLQQMIERFIKILRTKYKISDLEMLFPGEFIKHTDPSNIIKIYIKLSSILESLSRGKVTISFGYGGAINTEGFFLETFDEICRTSEKGISFFDCLFFFRLHDNIVKNGIQKDLDSEKSILICKFIQDQWIEEMSDPEI